MNLTEKMNSDCISKINEFAGLKIATIVNRQLAMIPKSVTIVGYRQLEDFYGWVRHFNTSNLREVRIVINCSAFMEHLRGLGDPFMIRGVPQNPRHPDGIFQDLPVGLVPPTVKKLTLVLNCEEVDMQIPDTVEELIIEAYEGIHGLRFPDTIRSIHFKHGFESIVRHWPENLERVHISGWLSGGRHPVPIRLPDTVKHIIVGSQLNVQFDYWPESLISLGLEGYPEDYGWSIDELGLPEGIHIYILENPYNEVPVDNDEDYDYFQDY